MGRADQVVHEGEGLALPAVRTRPPLRHDATTIDRLAAVLARAEYTRAALERLLGADAFDAGRADVPILDRRAGGEPLGALIRLFFLDLAVSEADLAETLDPPLIAALATMGAVSRTGDRVLSEIRLVPYGDLVLAGDHHSGAGTEPDDLVQPVTRSATDCLDLTVRGQVDRALDLGTGSGIQALVARSHAAEIVATDVNERALDLARLNARLNGVDGIEFRAGSLFEPVAGETFGLISCNAPFVVSPESQYAYRDGPTADDGLSAQVVREAPGHLAEGGFATIMVSWIEQEGIEPGARAADWASGTGCDVWVLVKRTHVPLDYAAIWNSQLVLDPAAYGVAIDTWVDNFKRLEATGISEGAVILRRRSGANWRRIDHVGNGAPRPAAAQLRRAFAAHDSYDGMTDADLLAETFVLAERHSFTQSFAAGADGIALQETKLRLDEGLLLEANVDPSVVALFAQMASGAPLGEAAAELGVPVDRAAAIVREMLQTGFLEPQE